MSQNNITNIIYFKNEILEDVKKIESNLNNKISQITKLIKTNSEEYDSKFSKITINITDLISKISTRNHDIEKIDDLLNTKNDIIAQINQNKNKLDNIKRELQSAIFKYDRAILDNLDVPGIVGYNGKYKTMRTFFEDIYNEVKAVQSFREQQTAGYNKYKEKIETLINNLQVRSKEIYNACNEICFKRCSEFEDTINKKIKRTEDLINKLRVDNSEYATELKTKVDSLNIDWEKFQNIKKDISKAINPKINKEFDEFKNMTERNNKEINSYNNELNIVKQKNYQLNDLIKDLESQINILKNKLYKLSKKYKEMYFKKSRMKKMGMIANNSMSYINDDILSFLNNEKNSFKINDSLYFNSAKNKKSKFFKNNSFKASRNKKDSNNIIYTLNSKTMPENIDIKEKKEVNLEITSDSNYKKKKRKIKKTSNRIIKKEIDINILAQSMNSISSSSLSDKNEISSKIEGAKNKSKAFTFYNTMSNKKLNILNNKSSNKNNKKKLQSNEYGSIDGYINWPYSDKKIKSEKNNIIDLKKSNKNVIYNMSELKIYSIRRKQKAKNNNFSSQNQKQKNILLDKQITDFNLISNGKIKNSNNSNEKGKKLILSDIIQNNNKDNNLLTLTNKRSMEDKNTVDYQKISRPPSAERIFPYTDKRNGHKISSVDTINNKGSEEDKFFITSNNEITKNNKNEELNDNTENIKIILNKVYSLENKYFPLRFRINEIYLMIKNLSNEINENKNSISNLKKNINYKDEKSEIINSNNSNSKFDFNSFLNKTLRNKKNALSLKMKHNKNKNYNKKMDNFDSSYKSKVYIDEENIILRRIDPFFIKAFKKKS